MASPDFSENARQLIFEAIDSVEQLEVLLLLRSRGDRSWSSAQVSAELRSSPKSVLNRLVALEQFGFLSRASDGEDDFQYRPKSDELDTAVSELADAYKIRPQKVFELIFSPLKKSRHFADAFLVTKPKKGNDDG